MNLQILDWDFGDTIPVQNSTESSTNTDSDESEEPNKDEYKNNTKFTIRVFGKNNKGESVSVIIHNFTLSFILKYLTIGIKNRYQTLMNILLSFYQKTTEKII